MKKLLYLSILSFPSFVFSTSNIASQFTENSFTCNDESTHTMKYISDGKHVYILFDDKNFIHDPDCKCDNEWFSITRDVKGNIINITNHIKKTVSQYD